MTIFYIKMKIRAGGGALRQQGGALGQQGGALGQQGGALGQQGAPPCYSSLWEKLQADRHAEGWTEERINQE